MAFRAISHRNGIPTREESSGFMSKMSIPCIFPKISNRSRPVACSTSEGTVPGCAPGGSRSSSVFTSTGRKPQSQLSPNLFAP